MDRTETQHPAHRQNVSFRLVGGENPLIIVPVHVNERGPYEFILDTGASVCLISPDLAAVLGIQSEVEKRAVGAGGAVNLALARANSLRVGAVCQQKIQVGITPEIHRIAAAIQSRVDGDLGFDFLKNYVLAIDYRDRTINLAIPFTVAGGSGSQTGRGIPFRLASSSKPLILIPTIINGEGPFQFALDTGASRTIISLALARRLGVETTNDSPATGGGGQIEIFKGKLKSLVVGTVAVSDHAIGAGEFVEMLSAAAGTELDGILGYNFLCQFRVTIDYPSCVLELEPSPVN